MQFEKRQLKEPCRSENIIRIFLVTPQKYPVTPKFNYNIEITLVHIIFSKTLFISHFKYSHPPHFSFTNIHGYVTKHVMKDSHYYFIS
jgi:hypothetical protein